MAVHAINEGICALVLVSVDDHALVSRSTMRFLLYAALEVTS